MREFSQVVVFFAVQTVHILFSQDKAWEKGGGRLWPDLSRHAYQARGCSDATQLDNFWGKWSGILIFMG